MIRTLRTRALVMTSVLFAAAMAGVIFAVISRKQIPIRPRQTDIFETQTQRGRQIWQADTGGVPALSATVWADKGAATLTLEFAERPLFADALVYWQAVGVADEHRRLLGPLAGGRRSLFALPAEVGSAKGRIVLFSLAHGEELRAFPLPQQELGPAAQEEAPQ